MEDKKTMIANLKFMSEKSKEEAKRLMDLHNEVLICLKKGTPKKLLDLVEASKKEGKGISIEALFRVLDYDMIIFDGYVQFDLSMHLDEVCEAYLSIALSKVPGWEQVQAQRRSAGPREGKALLPDGYGDGEEFTPPINDDITGCIYLGRLRYLQRAF